MIKDNQKSLNHVQVLLDAVVTAAAYVLAWFIIVSGKVVPLRGATLEPGPYFVALIFIVPVYLILNGCFHLYVPKRIQGRRVEFANICKANVIGLMLFTLILFGGRSFIVHLGYFSTRMLLVFFALNILLLAGERLAIRLFLRSLRTNGYNQKHVLMIGYSRAAEGFIDRVSLNPEWGYHIQGILDDHKDPGYVYKKIPVLGPISHLETFLAANTLDEIVITLSIGEYANLEQIVAACEKSGVHTKFIPDYNNIIPTIPYMEDLQGLPVINIRHVPLTNVFNATVKRCVDIFGALFGITLFSPLMLITAALLHDVGKTKELSSFPLNDYTDEGQLLGHIIIGAQMIHDLAKEIPDFPEMLENQLVHCILAHHGELEYGSPKKPALVEAVALNLADNTDARMETLTEIFAADKGKKEWLGYNRLFESNLRRTGDV